MSGHSHWATIRRKKGAADAKRGQIFTRLAREIVIAAREGGGDPDSNVRLGLAVDRARAQNMPKENIERAIKRGTGEGKEGGLEEAVYEGYAPHGVAVLVSVVTDNRNRTVAELRHTLSRYGGSMAEAGSVSWQFKRVAFFGFDPGKQDTDKIFEMAVESGADDVTIEDDWVEIIGPVEAFKDISDAHKSMHVTAEEAELRYIPNNPIELDDEDTVQVYRVIESLEELDDTQNVYSTMTISESALARIEAA